MTDWASLSTTYGDGAHLPGLLDGAAATTDWNAPARQQLWSDLAHQGSIAEAAYAALPMLLNMARARPEVPLDPALFLACAILAEGDPDEVVRLRSQQVMELDGLRAVAVGKLALVEGRMDVLYTLGCVAAVEDLSVWQRCLMSLADGEVVVECPACGDNSELEPGDEGEPWAGVDPASTSELGPAEARLLELCNTYATPGIRRELLHLFGWVTCRVCSARFPASDGLA